MNYTFSKHERLCSRSLIERLFSQGSRHMLYPYSVRLLTLPTNQLPAPAQILIQAPKRHLHHAVDRNRTKRLTRECYRLVKPQIYTILNDNDAALLISLTYLQDHPLPYNKLMQRLDRLPQLIAQHLQLAQ